MSTIVGQDLRMRGHTNEELAKVYYQHREKGLMKFDYLEFHPTEGGVNLIIDDGPAEKNDGITRKLAAPRDMKASITPEKVDAELKAEPKDDGKDRQWRPLTVTDPKGELHNPVRR